MYIIKLNRGDDLNKTNKYGITMISIIAMITIMIIIISTVVISYDNIQKNVLKKDFAKEIYMVEQQVKKYVFMNNKLPISNEDITLNLNNSDLKEQFASEGQNLTTVKLYPINLYEADIEQLKYGMGKLGDLDKYVVSKETNLVYYLNGIEIDGKVYYKLTDDLKKQIDINNI